MSGGDEIKRYFGNPKMKMEADLHATDWKSGTEALGVCMICGAEYPPDAGECPDCHVSLSVVRRCPHCQKIVSAQHKKCVYCHTPFTEELLHQRVPSEMPGAPGKAGPSPAVRRFQAVLVSVSTFVICFILGMWFLRQINHPAASPPVIAQAKVLRNTRLRLTASATASNAGEVSSGTLVNLVPGYQENDAGRWLAVDWKSQVAYLPADALSPPRAAEATEGARLLKFYLAGMDREAAAESVAAVDDYARSFPRNAHTQELRFALAERLKSLAQRGGPQAADLRRLAGAQYEQLADANGQFAGKSREMLAKNPALPQPEAKPRVAAAKKDGLQIIGGGGTAVSSIPSTAHDVLVLTEAEVRVRPGKLSQLSAGTVVPARVASQVKANGIVAIPAGAACQLTVLSADASGASLTLGLSSIEIDHRTYAVRSQPVDIQTGGAREHALSFRLEAPLVISK